MGCPVFYAQKRAFPKERSFVITFSFLFVFRLSGVCFFLFLRLFRRSPGLLLSGLVFLLFGSRFLVVLLLDVSRGLEQEDLEITDLLKEFENKKILILANKQDLDKKIEISEIEDLLPGSRILETSLTGEDDDSIRQMENTITDMVMGGEVRQANSMMVTNVRHLDLLKNCLSAIGDAIDITRLSEPLELIEIDISRGYGFLGEIIGEETSDDIINEVFARFCLGK